MTTRKTVYVLSANGSWRVKCEDTLLRTVANKDDAIKIAKKHVGDRPKGTHGQIRVQRGDGTWQTEWTYGVDPYPPRG